MTLTPLDMIPSTPRQAFSIAIYEVRVLPYVPILDCFPSRSSNPRLLTVCVCVNRISLIPSDDSRGKNLKLSYSPASEVQILSMKYLLLGNKNQPRLELRCTKNTELRTSPDFKVKYVRLFILIKTSCYWCM